MVYEVVLKGSRRGGSVPQNIKQVYTRQRDEVEYRAGKVKLWKRWGNVKEGRGKAKDGKGRRVDSERALVNKFRIQ